MECEANIFYAICKCILFNMPRPFANINICDPIEFDCVNWVNNQLNLRRNSRFTCSQCVRGCFDLKFDTSFSTAKIFERDAFILNHKLDIQNVAIFHTYYGASNFQSRRKEELVGFNDFLCNKN